MPVKRITRKMRGGGSLSPAPWTNTGVQFTPGNIPNIQPNTLNKPTSYSSNAAKVAGRGCAGDRLSTVAAKGMYKPYGMSGGGNLVRLQKNPLIQGAITGPKAGYASIGPGALFSRTDLQNPESLGAGPVAGVGLNATKRAFPLTGGRRKRKSRRHVKHHKKHKRKSQSKGKYKRKASRRKASRRTSRRKIHRGGAPQPYSNQPISFGYSLGDPLPKGKPIYSESALANPPPHHIYDNCPKK